MWVMALGAADGWRTPLLALVLMLWLGTWLAGLVNIFRSTHRPAVRWGWVAVVTLVPLLGFLLYWAVEYFKVKLKTRLTARTKAFNNY